LDFNRNRHAVDMRAYVRTVGSEWAFQRRIADIRLALQRLENLHLALLVSLGFSGPECARKGIHMGEVIHL
jgi:hypothetical protein